MSFGQGFVTGLADSLATGLKDDMEKTYDKISQMSALRAKTIVEGSQKHATEFKSFKDGLKSIAAVVNNDMDLVDYLVDQAGGNIDAALAKANEVKNAVANTSGKFSAYDLLGLEQRKNSPSITATQIANRIKGAYVPPPKVSGEMAVGMNQLFRKDISSAINTETDELLSASGITFDKKQDDDVPFIETLSSAGERTKFINAYNEKDSRKRAIKFGHIAENIAVLMGMTDNEAELADLQNQFDIANSEVEIHKTIIKNIDNKFQPPKPFEEAAKRGMRKDILSQLHVYAGLEYAVKLDGTGGFNGNEWFGSYKNKAQGRFLLDKANKIVNELSFINSYYMGSGKNMKTFTDVDPDVVQNTRTKILNLISEGKDYEIKMGQDTSGNPTVDVIPARVDVDVAYANEISAMDNLLGEFRQISEDTDEISTAAMLQNLETDIEATTDSFVSPFKPFFSQAFVADSGETETPFPPQENRVPIPENITQLMSDVNVDVGNISTTPTVSAMNEAAEVNELEKRFAIFTAKFPQAPPSDPKLGFLPWYKKNYPNTFLNDQQIMGLSGAVPTTNQNTGIFSGIKSALKAGVNMGVTPEIQYQQELKKNKGAEYNLTGQTFDNIKVNKVMVTNAGTIQLEITEENGSTTKIGSLHPKYTKLVEAGFDLQKAVESAK
mgnify:FL=1|jgi:hypothetical protein